MVSITWYRFCRLKGLFGICWDGFFSKFDEICNKPANLRKVGTSIYVDASQSTAMKRPRSRHPLGIQPLEGRRMLAASLHNEPSPADVNGNGTVSAVDAVIVVNYLAREDKVSGESLQPHAMVDVNGDESVSPVDALMVLNHVARGLEPEAEDPGEFDFGTVAKADNVDGFVDEFEFDAQFKTQDGRFTASIDPRELDTTELEDNLDAIFNDRTQEVPLKADNLLTESDVDTLLRRASMATSREDAIIAVVDRTGRILGVRVEDKVSSNIKDNDDRLAFAIDGAVAKARTAAFFSSNAAPLTTRTIRSLSQTTITQREVESAPFEEDDLRYKGPGLVAPIGVGGHFPPEINFAPQVDLFAIEHQSRDSQRYPGLDGRKGTDDDFFLNTRFNADPQFVPRLAEDFFKSFPNSFGEQSGISPTGSSRGIGTLPGGVPLYKLVSDAAPGAPLSQQFNLVGGIGVFFPGEDGFATHEQGFKHRDENGGRVQTEKQRYNAPLALEAEAAAFLAAAGRGIIAGQSAFHRDLSEFNNVLPPLPNFFLPAGRIDLVGITLEIYGPNPDRSFRQPGLDRVIHEARKAGIGEISGFTVNVARSEGLAEDADPDIEFLSGQPVPSGWLVAPHDSKVDGGLTAEQVEQIILTGEAEARRTRAAIRLNIDNGFRPGVPTGMVLAVSDTDGELLGLFRMPDATIFSIDVSVAKSRNTAYYADADDLQLADQVDLTGDGIRDETRIRRSTDDGDGDTYQPGTALTNRSFRFLGEPRFPTGSELSSAAANFNDGEILCSANPTICKNIGPHSGLRLRGINPVTAENADNDNPVSFEFYASRDHASTVIFDSFNVSSNFRDPGDASVRIAGSNKVEPLANQNGVVFFPGSTPLYLDNQTQLVGGFGVSGDGVDQDDVVTFAGQQGFDPTPGIRVDTFTIGGIRVPFQKFNRNPLAVD